MESRGMPTSRTYMLRMERKPPMAAFEFSEFCGNSGLTPSLQSAESTAALRSALSDLMPTRFGGGSHPCSRCGYPFMRPVLADSMAGGVADGEKGQYLSGPGRQIDVKPFVSHLI